ncbi:hypothetical protein J0A78_06430 [Providencia rettgeri]|uniref:hypothetical protein n=1 Tax=Morganellaceae TaxID=1903414 RepID=UPI000BA0C196|nr:MULTISPECIES: hypothetical protein [Morganellaceae]MBN7840130.1 hypothetical protein [Providencia rettgeri]MBN7853050.1 hypothetical protein [Providencia rettgeri]MBN7861137.1 hypothetical protein [Providencia rettgeri]MBN7871394.1 hypothetical protein [Providencia rettgeri]MBN7897605.1 hypothetical protein [Providencia rettgeri]
MLNTICIDTAKYKASLASSLYSVILEKASDECSQELLDLISIACDLNQQISQSLRDKNGVSA